jgi:hypothetical protein
MSDTEETHSCPRIRLLASVPRPPELPSRVEVLDEKWRQLLVCQSPVEALEIVQKVNRRGAKALKFRTIISRPDGLRMGFLYDAVKHWREVEHGGDITVLLNRRTGDLVSEFQIYPEGPGFKEVEDKPCITILGTTSVGCGPSGGLTYCSYRQNIRDPAQVIRSGSEKVTYTMHGQIIDFDVRKLWASITES